MTPGAVTRSAMFDPTRRYRYALVRTWDRRAGRLAFVMLNPSRADEHTDDPTIRRCMGLARAWGYGSLIALNLFAWMATRPADLRLARDPVGPDNDAYLARLTRSIPVLAAWGVHGPWRARDDQVLTLLRSRNWLCLGLTRHGHPRHPLYLPAHVRPRPLVIPPPAPSTAPPLHAPRPPARPAPAGRARAAR